MKTLWITGLVLLLVAGGAQARSSIGFGVGAFGGVSVPVVQDDATASGLVFGIRVPVHLISVVSVEPYLASSSLGDTDFTFGGTTYTRSGFDITGFGANIALANLVDGAALNFYPFGGIGSYTLKRAQDPDVTETTFTGGLGFTIHPQHKVGVHVRAEAVIVKQGDASRKFGQGTVGFSYALTQ